MLFLNPKETERLKRAIERAERNTSGEIRLFVEETCSEDVLDRAVKCFYQLEMDKTNLQNGVLIYLSLQDRKFAIIGDKGIDAVVPPGFWNVTKENMLAHFRKNELVEGLEKGILMAGEQLQQFFPFDPNSDQNELSDDIVFNRN